MADASNFGYIQDADNEMQVAGSREMGYQDGWMEVGVKVEVVGEKEPVQGLSNLAQGLNERGIDIPALDLSHWKTCKPEYLQEI